MPRDNMEIYPLASVLHVPCRGGTRSSRQNIPWLSIDAPNSFLIKCTACVVSACVSSSFLCWPTRRKHFLPGKQTRTRYPRLLCVDRLALP